MTAGCPSDLQLEAYLLDRASSRAGPHVEACEACRARLERMEAEGEEFRRYVYPATVEAVVGAAPGRSRLRWLAVLAPVAAAVTAVLLLRPAPPDDYVGVKGEALGLKVFVAAAGGARALEDGAAVPPGAALRFRVRPSAPCRLWIVSIDSAGQLSRLYPATGDGGAEIAAAGALPGGAVLDQQVGPERIYATCTLQALPLESLAGLCRAAVGGGGPQAVRSAASLRGLPAGAAQASLLLEKRP